MESVKDSNLDSDSKDYEGEIKRLDAEKRKMREEFDSQRAKMKDLFLQKEDELSRKKVEIDTLNRDYQKLQAEIDDVKSRLLVADMQLESNVAVAKRKADEEIASLQQLVHETVEESSCSKSIFDSEVRKLQSIIRQLEAENSELKNEKQQSPHHMVQESSSLAPSVVLSAVTKKLAKKLGADTYTFTSQEDDHREDTELLKSLVGPLEEEIKALKTKLRATDEQLQRCRHCSEELEMERHKGLTTDMAQPDGKSPLQTTSTNTSFETKIALPCDMCSNYEAQLVREQKHATDLEAKVVLAEKSVERHKEDLLKEIGFRKDMEEKWNEKKEEHKKQVAELTTRMECCEQDMKELQEVFDQACDEMRGSLALLEQERETVQQELNRLQKENDNLVGKYSIHSQELQSEFINLPDTVEELQELLLKSHQDLIIAKIGKEAKEDECNSLRSDLMLLKDQINSEQEQTTIMESSLMNEIEQLKLQKDQVEKEHSHYQLNVERFRSQEKEIQEKFKEAHNELEDVRRKKRLLEEKNAELKSKVAYLQQELDTNETVQKDFVLLSQNLQVQLEKIRDADTQVRWQHDEDVSDCPSCRQSFSAAKRKEHCKHCGQIFCTTCLTHSVPSGPHQRPSKVCDVCHTLLVKSSAPYFSTEAPHSPD